MNPLLNMSIIIPTIRTRFPCITSTKIDLVLELHEKERGSKIRISEYGKYVKNRITVVNMNVMKINGLTR